MVHNTFIRCQVCGSITRIRLQVGWLEEHPIIVTCGKCNTSLLGQANIRKKTIGLSLAFDNADILGADTKEDFLVECSGEFPTLKQSAVTYRDLNLLTPYIRIKSRMKDNNSYDNFCKSVLSLIETEKNWKGYKRILELSQNKSEYLIQEIKKNFQGEFFQCRDEFEVLRAVHLIEVHGFYSSIKKEIIEKQSFCNDILKLDPKELEKFLEYMNNHESYKIKDMQDLVYKILEEFIEVYRSFIPAIFLQYCKKDIIDYEKEGTTTSSFDMAKQFYLNSFESLGNLIIVPVALNNIKYRGSFEQLCPIGSREVSLDDFIGLSKTNRYKYCVSEEEYTNFIGISVNSKIRNAIGHNDVEYDSVSQTITYIPNPKDRTKKLSKYLLEFETEALNLFQGILTISEYLYILRKYELILNGAIPKNYNYSIRARKKIGRNELCPCGSEKKYKYCHGKNS